MKTEFDRNFNAGLPQASSVDKKPRVPVTTNSSDTGFDEVVDICDEPSSHCAPGDVLTDDDPLLDIKTEQDHDDPSVITPCQMFGISKEELVLMDLELPEIWFNSDNDVDLLAGSVKGGMLFNISLTAELSEDDKSGIAHFGGIGDAPLEKLNPYTLCGIIPGSQQPGTFQVTVNTQAGQLLGMTYFTYVDETQELLKQLVKDPAQRSQFFSKWALQELSSISGSDSNIAQDNAVTEDETDFKSAQSKDDDNQSDYFADDETSCGSFELEVGWEEDGEGTCTTKDGGFKKEPSEGEEKEPSEGEDASIEVPPETGTQFDENLEKGDESYEEPSIIDSKHSLSLHCQLCEDLLLNAGDDTTARQQGVGEPIEGEDASIEVPPDMGTQFEENLEMTKGDESCKEPSIIDSNHGLSLDCLYGDLLLSGEDDTTARQQGAEETQEIGSFTQTIGGRTQKIDDSDAEQQEANACPSQERKAKPKSKTFCYPP
ncbi:hypothetical protein OS493_025677 [Desmophyllum pertusum]|uniref:Uncharacterized protein n=1 Tax=Desmophyllum pertusum TaxID=174260 RepID=A0A9W9ZLA2_9CNID|nr:hypothetical protein OS493_025677 [Desmophyllum pertusum]